MKSQPVSSTRSAFTLIEVLTVVAIVAMLAAMSYAGLRYAMKKSKEKDTIALLADVGKTIQEYRDEQGNYPRPAVPDENITIEAESWRVGEAKMLYQVLSGDGTDAIKGGEKLPTGEQGSAKEDGVEFSGKVYMDTVIAPTKQQVEDKKKLKTVATAGDSSYYVIDPFRHPLRYQVAEKDKNGKITNDIEMHSASAFELWSYASLTKQDDGEEGQKKWITNWGSN